MKPQRTIRISVNRKLVGLCAALCLGGAGFLWYRWSPGGTGRIAAEQGTALLAALTRVGLVLAALWIALPPTGQVDISPRVLVVGFAALVGVALRPKFFIPLLLALAVLAFLLRPRKKAGRK